jgi:hypothetical protein
MAQRYISLNRGQSGLSQSDFVTGTSSNSSGDVEIRFNDAVNLTRMDLRTMLEVMMDQIDQGLVGPNSPPS